MIHYGNFRTVPGTTGLPRSALATAAKHSARLARLFRALLHRLAFLFDRREQFGHRAVEAVGEPGADELRPGDAGGRRQLHLLMILIGADAGDRAVAAGDEHAIEPAQARVAVEDERRLRRSDTRWPPVPRAARRSSCVVARAFDAKTRVGATPFISVVMKSNQ